MQNNSRLQWRGRYLKNRRGLLNRLQTLFSTWDRLLTRHAVPYLASMTYPDHASWYGERCEMSGGSASRPTKTGGCQFKSLELQGHQNKEARSFKAMVEAICGFFGVEEEPDHV